jgi:SAM-dependent methyltransferase
VTLGSDEMRAVYGGAAGAWAAGPAAVYEALASPLVSDCPIPLDGAAVLDFGAGTGATSRAVTSAGTRITATDLSIEMLQAERQARPPAANADALRLPFRDEVFDVAVGAFVISHVPDPAAALREVARTVHRHGILLTVGFDGRWEFSAKATIEDVMAGFGLRRPEWYDTFKREIEPLTAFPDRLETVARTAGLLEVEIHEHAVDVGVRTADEIIAWRLGFPMYAMFMVSLDDETRIEVLDALRAALGPDPDPLVPELLVLVGRVDSRDSN